MKADIEWQGLIIQMDGNLHVGDKVVKNDPNQTNQNGRLFLRFLDALPHLTVVNGMDRCNNVITRRRHFVIRREESVLDFFELKQLQLQHFKH